MSNIGPANTAPLVGWGERLKLRVGTIVWFLLVVCLLLSLPVLFDIHWLAVLAVAVLALLLAAPIAWLVRRLFAGQRRSAPLTTYLKSILAVFAVLCTLIAAPIYALGLVTALRPMVVPQATLSNGTKTVVFQGMTHIGSEGFYKSVVYDLEKALTEGYVLFYEGVTKDPAGDAWFSETLAGGGDLSDNYKQYGSACGLTFQLDYFTLLQADMAVHPERHVAADVSTADMMSEYQRLVDTDPVFAASVENAKAPAPAAGERTGGTGKLFELIAQATPAQQSLVATACRGWTSWLLMQRSTPSPLDRVILDFRNSRLAGRIEAAPQDKIYITYGAGHLPGLLKLLQTDDPAWEIKSLKWLRTIEAPEDFEGQLE